MIELNGTSLVFALSFLLFVYLLDFALWKPVSKIKEERAIELKTELDSASQAEEKTKSILKQVSQEISSLKKVEHDAIEKLFRESKLEEDQEEAKLKNELEIFKEKAKSELLAERDSLLGSLEEQSKELANLISNKVAPEYLTLGPANDLKGAVV
jgi:F-type H+-transporting ATPase subunit b